MLIPSEKHNPAEDRRYRHPTTILQGDYMAIMLIKGKKTIVQVASSTFNGLNGSHIRSLEEIGTRVNRYKNETEKVGLDWTHPNETDSTTNQSLSSYPQNKRKQKVTFVWILYSHVHSLLHDVISSIYVIFVEKKTWFQYWWLLYNHLVKTNTWQASTIKYAIKW